MSTVLLPMKRFADPPPEVAPRDGPQSAALALVDVVGEAAPVRDRAPSAGLTWVLAAGATAASPARDGSPQPATAASMAADAAHANAERHRRRGCR
jgi:hypothetical protein